MKKGIIIPGIEISSEREDLICYSFDSSIVEAGLPAAVAWPRSAEEVVRIVRFAYEKNMKLLPRGAGTGMAGAAVPHLKDSIVVSFEKMRRIIDIDSANMTALVEPGTINGKLQRDLEHLGFFYPPDPASLNISTIGGNVATNAGGPRAIKYGVTRDYVLGIEAVLPDGSLVNLGGRTYKRVVGYDLKQLLIGSEGTLGFATKIRLKILPQPEDVITLLIVFSDIERAGAAVSGIINARVIPRCMEFMDRSALEAVEQYKPTGLPTGVEALLLVELDGYPAAIQREAERVMSVCHELGGETSVAEDKLAREKLWEARRSISPALYHLKPNKINEDIVVPRDKIPHVLAELRRMSRESGITIVSFGHAGDGNIHVNIMADKNDAAEYAKGKELVKKVFELALSSGGSLSGEHGIGLAKLPYVGMEIGEREMQLMRGVKRLVDPRSIMNPGKIFV